MVLKLCVYVKKEKKCLEIMSKIHDIQLFILKFTLFWSITEDYLLEPKAKKNVFEIFTVSFLFSFVFFSFLKDY